MFYSWHDTFNLKQIFLSAHIPYAIPTLPLSFASGEAASGRGSPFGFNHAPEEHGSLTNEQQQHGHRPEFGSR